MVWKRENVPKWGGPEIRGEWPGCFKVIGRQVGMLQPRYTEEHLWAQSLLILERENHTWCHSHQVKTGNSGYHSHRITKIFTTIQTGGGVLMWEIFSLHVGPHSTVCRIVPVEHCLNATAYMKKKHTHLPATSLGIPLQLQINANHKASNHMGTNQCT